MTFSIDESKYRIVDLSHRVTPPGTPDRPLTIERGLLPDGAYKYEVSTHTHVGTHIEAPAHFYEDAKRAEDFGLESFYGRGVLFEMSGVDGENVDGAKLEADIGSLIRDGDIVCMRNTHPDWRKIQAEDASKRPWIDADGCRWLVEKKVKMLFIHDFCGIGICNNIETARENHAVLFEPGKEILILEFPDGLEQLTKKEFFVMALPVKFHGLDSVWTRAIAIEER